VQFKGKFTLRFGPTDLCSHLTALWCFIYFVLLLLLLLLLSNKNVFSDCLKRLYDKSAGLGLLVRVVSFAFCIFFTNFIMSSLLIIFPCPSLHLFTEIDKLNVYYSFVA